jgi:hypothetical protein
MDLFTPPPITLASPSAPEVADEGSEPVQFMVTADGPNNEPAASTIPVAPPMSSYFPSCAFKVICRYCFHDDHDICYKQCPSCYKKKMEPTISDGDINVIKNSQHLDAKMT